ncbi:PepSY domain-containing protein [Aureimonas endophytica]|uniref:PepSY domain-containing protein n=1 Tax=Aureimonas endophytica TaxID=2027858 RepID=UPI0016697E40|nr:PepSY domain-containing protein [Aureimonas endophytica]
MRGPEGALEAVQANEALPLDQIVTAARHLTEGEIIDARLELVDKMLEYELKVLEANGDVRRYSFDARTGQLMGVR